jgi:hypothetical protein
MNAIRQLVIIVTWIVVGGAVGCAEPTPVSPTTKPTDVGPIYVAPNGTSARTIDGIEYEFIATPDREAQIIAGFPQLMLGQSREEVRAALGLPDAATPGYGKEYNAFRGWGYIYKIKMRAGGPNTNDVCVQVFFNPAGELKWAVPNHIPGLKEVGGPAGP